MYRWYRFFFKGRYPNRYKELKVRGWIFSAEMTQGRLTSLDFYKEGH